LNPLSGDQLSFAPWSTHFFNKSMFFSDSARASRTEAALIAMPRNVSEPDQQALPAHQENPTTREVGVCSEYTIALYHANEKGRWVAPAT